MFIDVYCVLLYSCYYKLFERFRDFIIVDIDITSWVSRHDIMYFMIIIIIVGWWQWGSDARTYI